MVIVLARNWWTLALRGLFAVLFGIMAFAWPGSPWGHWCCSTAPTPSLTACSRSPRRWVGRTVGVPWWALLIEGLAGIVVGIITLLWPGITALVLLYLIAFWAVVTGVFEIVPAIRLRKEIRGEWLLALSGVLSVLFGVALIVSPGAGALAVVWLIGAYAIVFGALMIALALRLRSLLSRTSHVTISPTGSRSPAI